MKQVSFLRKLTAALLSCMLCCTGMTVSSVHAEESSELPVHFDLRDEHAVTSVKSQYGGTCGIFSAIAAIESNMIKQGMADDSIDLSEEHFSYFSQVKGNPEDPEDPLRNDRTDNDMKAMANAGSYLDAIGILGSWMGVVPASMTPRYKDKTPLDESLRYESVAHLQNVTKFNVNDTKTIKKNLMEKGAMQVSYFNVHSPKLYSEYGGYYQTLWSARSKLEGQDSVDGGVMRFVLLAGMTVFQRSILLKFHLGMERGSAKTAGASQMKIQWMGISTYPITIRLYMISYSLRLSRQTITTQSIRTAAK